MIRPASCYFWLLHQALVTNILFVNARIVPAYLSLQYGHRIKDELKLQEKGTTSMLQCATWCAGTGSCVTASFNQDDGACHLSEFSGDAENLISGSSWTAVYKNGTGAMATSSTTNGVTDTAPIGPTDPEPIGPPTTASNSDPPAVPSPSVCGSPPAPVVDTPPNPNSPPAPVAPPVECGAPPPPINTSPTVK